MLQVRTAIREVGTVDEIQKRDAIEEAVGLPPAEHHNGHGFASGLFIGILIGAAVATVAYIALSLWFR
jgi:hypothetical protein